MIIILKIDKLRIIINIDVGVVVQHGYKHDTFKICQYYIGLLLKVLVDINYFKRLIFFYVIGLAICLIFIFSIPVIAASI